MNGLVRVTEAPSPRGLYNPPNALLELGEFATMEVNQLLPRVDLISYTPYPLEVIYSAWHASRTDHRSLTSKEISEEYGESKDINDWIRISNAGGEGARAVLESVYEIFPDEHGVFEPYISPVEFYTGPANRPFFEEFDEVINGVINLDFPLKELVMFTFSFSDITISWREQAVRQRKAVTWSQTSRTRDLSKFVDNGWFYVPDSIKNNPAAFEKFMAVVEGIQGVYKELLSMGVHREDARALMPGYQTHRLVQGYSARTLEATMEDRICFIAQVELWGPVIHQIKDVLTKIDPRLSALFHPPCIKNGKYVHCPVEYENIRRHQHKDPMGECPLWAMHQGHAWNDVPMRSNAEKQYQLQRAMWPREVVTQVDEYINATSADL